MARALLEARLALRVFADAAHLHHLSLDEDEEEVEEGGGVGKETDALVASLLRETVPAIVWGAKLVPSQESNGWDTEDDDEEAGSIEESSSDEEQGAHGFYISRKRPRVPAAASADKPPVEEQDTIVVNFRGKGGV
ncbi:hypothetical protein T484DRAFT_1955982 [Baffinella frigidus]|nr:hypothetical protein T484DRAFT_1955982 [Cryptophyta sp. CCMP2293]